MGALLFFGIVIVGATVYYIKHVLLLTPPAAGILIWTGITMKRRGASKSQIALALAFEAAVLIFTLAMIGSIFAPRLNWC